MLIDVTAKAFSTACRRHMGSILNHCNHGNNHYLTRLVVFDRACGCCIMQTRSFNVLLTVVLRAVTVVAALTTCVCSTHCSGVFLRRVQICTCWYIVSSANAIVQKVKGRCVVCQFIVMIQCCVCTVRDYSGLAVLRVPNNFPGGR